MKSKLLFVLLFLFFTKVFQMVGVNIPNAILSLVMGLFVVIEFKNNTEFSFLIKSYICCIFVSCISSYIYREQYDVFRTFTQSFNYLSLCFYFVCLWLNLRIKDFERGLVIVGLISIVAYFIQNAVYPKVIFADALTDYADDVRIRMCGSLIYSFLFFWGINRYVTDRSWKYLFYSTLSFICIIIMGFRTLTVALLALGVFEYLYVSGISAKKVKQLLPLVLIVVVVSQFDVVNDKVTEMLSRQERGDNFGNSDYIRFIEFNYYWNNFFTDIFERIFGCGLPILGTSFFQFMQNNYDLNLYWNDWGLLGFSWIFGMPATILIYYMYIKVILSKLPKEYIYLKVLFAFLILTSLTTAEAFRSGNLLLQGAFLFLVMSIKKQNNKTISL